MMNKRYITTLAASFALLFPFLVHAYSFLPTDDALVDENAKNSTYSGVALKVQVDGNSIDDLELRSFLRFDISAITSGETVTNVTLRLFVNFLNRPPEVGIYSVGNTSWQEETITWHNAPSYGTLLSTSSSFPIDDWCVFTLPISSITGQSVSFMLKSQQEDYEGKLHTVAFDSKESTNAPILEIATSTNPVPEPATLLLMGAGMAGIIVGRYRKQS